MARSQMVLAVLELVPVLAALELVLALTVPLVVVTLDELGSLGKQAVIRQLV